MTPLPAISPSSLLADRVCQARDEARLSNAELALRAGVPRRTIVRITNGHNKTRLNQETLEAIAQATGKPLSFFAVNGVTLSLVTAAAENLVAVLMAAMREEMQR